MNNLQWLADRLLDQWEVVVFLLLCGIVFDRMVRYYRRNAGTELSVSVEHFCDYVAIGSMIAGLIAALVHVLHASVPGETRLLEAGFMLLAGILCGTLISLAGRLAVNEAISVDSKWGVLGGAGSGYSVSRPVVLLAIFAACLTALLAIGYIGVSQKKGPEPKPCVQCCCYAVGATGGQ